MASRKATPLIDLPARRSTAARVSPDGRWMAYASNETGRYEVWLEPLPQSGARYQLTRERRLAPAVVARWPVPLLRSRASDVSARGEYEGRRVDAEPTPLPIKGFVQAEYRRQFDLMPNGREFLMLFPTTVRATAQTAVPVRASEDQR